MYYSLVNYYYSMGFYSNEDVKAFVMAGNLTAEEYEQITGEVYSA